MHESGKQLDEFDFLNGDSMILGFDIVSRDGEDSHIIFLN